MSARDEHWQKYIEGCVYQLREMMCWWPETSGITEAIAQYLMRTLPAELDAYAAEVRLATLREVRKAAMALDKDPSNDPYLWGYGGGEICKMIGAKVREARGEQ